MSHKGDGVNDELGLPTRPEMLVAHEEFAQALKTAKALPPLQPASREGLCEGCGKEVTRICKLVEGREVLICGACALREMDAWEAAHGQNG